MQKKGFVYPCVFCFFSCMPAHAFRELLVTVCSVYVCVCVCACMRAAGSRFLLRFTYSFILLSPSAARSRSLLLFSVLSRARTHTHTHVRMRARVCRLGGERKPEMMMSVCVLGGGRWQMAGRGDEEEGSTAAHLRNR